MAVLTMLLPITIARSQPTEPSLPGAPATTRTATASTAPPNPSFDMSFGTSITTDYNYRGYTLSDRRPSVAAYFEATYDILYAGVNASSVRLPDLPRLQNTYSAGVRPVFGDTTVEIGVGYYDYPGSHGVINYPEYYVRPSYKVSATLTLGLNFYYAPDYIRSGAWENYNSVTLKYAFTDAITFSGEIGRQLYGPPTSTEAAPQPRLHDYSYWNLGFSYAYKTATLDLRYHANTLSKQSCFLITGTGDALVGSKDCGASFIATLSLDSTLSALKTAIAPR